MLHLITTHTHSLSLSLSLTHTHTHTHTPSHTTTPIYPTTSPKLSADVVGGPWPCAAWTSAW